jgi:DNA-binding transcriptional MerR regulator
MSSPALSIGEFSRMTHLSAKALRFYHREGLLEPAGIDPVNGYREYSVEQLPTAQVIRRFRALEMPVDAIRAVLRAPDPAERNALIVAHLSRMEEQLASTRAAVESLRSLLSGPGAAAAISIERRSLPDLEVLRIDDVIDLADLGRWYTNAFHELDAAVARSGLPVTGPRGGLWSTELFRDERGAVTVFRPVALSGVAPSAHRGAGAERVRADVLPGGDFAVTVHSGPDEDADLHYGSLGAYVSEHELSVDGPVRETYLVSEFDLGAERVTAIAWPIFRTAL